MKEKNPVKRISTTCRFHLIRNRYYAGKISHEECLESLLKLYHDRDKNLYDVSGIVENMQLPSDIIRLIWKDELTTEELDNLLLIQGETQRKRRTGSQKQRKSR